MCPADAWCQFPNHDCGGTDDTGICVKRPVDCSGVPSNPVCGCNGQSYPNACLAEQAGVDVHAGGPCQVPQLFACGPMLSCKTGLEYCDDDNGIVAAYSCQPLPTSCLPPNTTDCACMPIAPDCGSCSGANGQITESHGCG
jgi:hypothetical protein